MMLDLQPECLARPTRLDVAEVEAMMLWPDDAEARGRWGRAAMLEEGASRIDDMPEALLRQFSKDALEGPRIAELQSHVGKRDAHGLIAGTIVLSATIYAHHAPEKAALRKVQERLCQHLKRTFQIEPRTINNRAGPIYPLRPVAHLWAAYMLTCHLGDDTFPCSVTEFSVFLATAEAIRGMAETSRAPKANATVMRLGEAVKLPTAVASMLPKVTLRVGS